MKAIKTIKKLLPAAIVAATVATPTLADGDGLHASLTVASNKVWRGMTRTDNGASVEASAHYQHESGIYAGVSIGNVAHVRPLLGSVPSSETDLFVGYTGGFEDFGWDAGYQYYLYTDTPNKNVFGTKIDDIDFGEIYVSLSYNIVSAGLAWTVHSDNGNNLSRGSGRFQDDDLYYWISLGGAIADGWSLAGTVGYYDFDKDNKTPVSGIKVESYTHFQIDLTKEAGAFGDVTLSLSYADENAQEYATTDARGGDDEVQMFVSWNKIF